MLKKWKTVFAVVCIAGLLCGCAGTPSSTPSSKAGTSSAVSASTPESEPASSGTTLASPSWKTDTSPITLEWFVGYDWASFTFDPANNEFDKWCLEETGVTISYSFGNQEKLNVLINTDAFPISLLTMWSPQKDCLWKMAACFCRWTICGSSMPRISVWCPL